MSGCAIEEAAFMNWLLGPRLSLAERVGRELPLRGHLLAWGSWSPGPGVLFTKERKQLAGQKKGESMFPLHSQSNTSLGLVQDLYHAKPGRCQSHGVSHLRRGLCGRRNDCTLTFSASLVFKQTPRFTPRGLHGTSTVETHTLVNYE